MGKQASSSKSAGLAKVREQHKQVSKHTKAIKKDTVATPIGIKVDDAAMKGVDKKKKTRLSSKKRRYMKLLAEKPQRDKNPADLRELQIQSVKKMLSKDKDYQLSRGQKKRLKKKEKFINSKMLETKAIET